MPLTRPTPLPATGHFAPSPAAARGFTLVEVVVVALMVAILALAALPSYQESLRKGRRSDAITALQAVQQAQERHRATSATYSDDLSELNGVSALSSGGYYSLVISTVDSGEGFLATASAVAGGPQESDSACLPMTLRFSRVASAAQQIPPNHTVLGPSDACWQR